MNLAVGSVQQFLDSLGLRHACSQVVLLHSWGGLYEELGVDEIEQ